MNELAKSNKNEKIYETTFNGELNEKIDETKLNEEIKFYVAILPCDVVLLTLAFNNYDILYGLMKCMFFSKSNFISYTKTDTDISVFIDNETFKQNVSSLDNNNMYDPNNLYSVLQIYEFLSGIDHIGVVKKISSILANKNIPILYINSANNNYVLVKKNRLQDTIKVLHDAADNFIFI